MQSPEHPAGRPRNPRTDVAVIDAVLDLVAEGSALSRISFVEIASRARASRNSLYRRWSSKDALFLDVLTAITKAFPEPTGSGARERVGTIVITLAERAADRRASAMVRALQVESSAFPELTERYFAEIVSPRRQLLLDTVLAGIATGELRADIDPEVISDVLVAPLLAPLLSLPHEHDDVVKRAYAIIDVVFDGIAAT